MDRFPRKLLAWRISNTPAADFCVAARNEAAHHCGPPEIMNAIELRSSRPALGLIG
ncbi:hypothetical protein [Paracoccus pantotrophus]|uniref:hypothetical protein n=1 Tax=Paracoccus pantotrophus TaxID=82367 RepID=UPI00160988E4|nr:hypothetical protein [Paracoccus pantotrophus]